MNLYDRLLLVPDNKQDELMNGEFKMSTSGATVNR